MLIGTALSEIAELQGSWSKDNTIAMKRRGVIVRSELPQLLRSGVGAVTGVIDQLSVEGRDGTGLKTEIPWVRVYSELRSPHATEGWYVVFLFSASGESAFLSLNQGATQWNGTDFVSRPTKLLKARVAWARDVLAPYATDDLIEDIALKARRSHLGSAYERGNVYAKAYQSGSIPGDGSLLADMGRLLTLLAAIYDAERTVPAPGDSAPEIVEAEAAVEVAAGKRRRYSGQGRRLRSDERKAIESRAVTLATEYLRADGWTVRDVGATESYDLHCKREGEVLLVEVKGTTTAGESIVLTPNEVRLHREKDNTMLAVVTAVVLAEKEGAAVATGGDLKLIEPFEIVDSCLKATGYTYKLPS